MHAVILAGGKGVRLRPYTTALPKPLVPDRRPARDPGDRAAPARRAPASPAAPSPSATSGEIIRAYVGDGSQWGLAVDYATEESPLGTMGPLLTMRDQLPEYFLVMNGDVLTDLDYADVLHQHRRSRRAADHRHLRPQGAHRLRGADHRRRQGGRLHREAEHGLPRLDGGLRAVPRAPSPATRRDCRWASTSWSSTCSRPRTTAARLRLRRVLAGHRPPGRLRPGQRRVHHPRVAAAQGSLSTVMRILVLGATGYPGRPRRRAAACPAGRAGARRRAAGPARTSASTSPPSARSSWRRRSPRSRPTP